MEVNNLEVEENNNLIIYVVLTIFEKNIKVNNLLYVKKTKEIIEVVTNVLMVVEVDLFDVYGKKGNIFLIHLQVEDFGLFFDN